ncbi:PITH domain-containing protein [Neurospora crassa]|nr:PITH domain-containing protein [Neurospora crassa]
MSHHCHDEHDDHHHHHEGGAEHDHSDDITPAVQFSLYQHINFDEITTLNEQVHGSGQAIIIKTWAERLATEPEVVSDADEQLIINVPFTAQIKLHSVLLRTSPSPSAPRTLRLLANADIHDFGQAEDSTPTQEFELSQTSEIQELPVKRAKFNAVQRLCLFFPDNFSQGEEDETRISYIGFKGEWMTLGQAPKNIVYEAAARPTDHKVKGTADARGVGYHRQG